MGDDLLSDRSGGLYLVPDHQVQAAEVTPIYKFKIVCGCGYYTTDSLGDWDDHLAELVANDDGNIKLHIDRTSVQMVQIDERNRA